MRVIDLTVNLTSTSLDQRDIFIHISEIPAGLKLDEKEMSGFNDKSSLFGFLFCNAEQEAKLRSSVAHAFLVLVLRPGFHMSIPEE